MTDDHYHEMACGCHGKPTAKPLSSRYSVIVHERTKLCSKKKTLDFHVPLNCTLNINKLTVIISQSAEHEHVYTYVHDVIPDGRRESVGCFDNLRGLLLYYKAPVETKFQSQK